MSLLLITPPAAEPVTLYELKLQCGLSPVEDTDPARAEMLSTTLRRYIRAARADCENRTRRCFIEQEWTLALDGWPRSDGSFDLFSEHGFRLPKPPLLSIVSFGYIDTTGAAQTLDATGYQLEGVGSETESGRLSPPYLQPWPLLQGSRNNVTITFTCGYGATPASVPEPIRDAILCLAHSKYDPTAYKDIDRTVDALLSVYVNRIS